MFFYILIHPLEKLNESGIKPIIALPGTTLSPANNAKLIPSTLMLYGKWSPTIASTRISCFLLVTSTEHVVSDKISGGGFAFSLSNNGYRYLLKETRIGRTVTLNQPTPTRDGTLAPRNQEGPCQGFAGKAHWTEVISEFLHRFVKLDQGYIAVIIIRDKVLVHFDVLHANQSLVFLRRVDIVVTQPDLDVGLGHRVFSNTVSPCDDPEAVDQRPTTEVFAVFSQPDTCNPRGRSHLGSSTSNDAEGLVVIIDIALGCVTGF